MPPSTSHASPRLSEAPARFGLEALDGFYRLHAPVYDWTRPLLLRGRREAVRRLAVRPGERVLDVGCGTGFSLPRLFARGARLTGIEPSPAMRQQAERRLERDGLAGIVELDPRPYGSHAEYEASVDAILFSYSLSMIPPFEEVLARARRDLRNGGRIAVVDFHDAWGPVGFGLRRSHVQLGPERLAALRRLFPRNELETRWACFWRYFVFVGRLEAAARLGGY